MSEIKMDAEIVASSIYKGDFSKLRGKSFKMCDNLNMKKKYTLNQIGEDLAKLTKYVTEGFKRVDKRIDNLEKDVSSLKQDVKDINARLDYIVDANNLKDNK